MAQPVWGGRGGGPGGGGGGGVRAGQPSNPTVNPCRDKSPDQPWNTPSLLKCFPGDGSAVAESDLELVQLYCHSSMCLHGVHIDNIYLLYNVGGVSSVGIATCHGLDGPGIEPRWGRDFPHPFRPTLRLLYIGYCTSLPGVKRPGRDFNHPPTSSAEVKERVDLGLHGLCQGELYNCVIHKYIYIHTRICIYIYFFQLQHAIIWYFQITKLRTCLQNRALLH